MLFEANSITLVNCFAPEGQLQMRGSNASQTIDKIRAMDGHIYAIVCQDLYVNVPSEAIFFIWNNLICLAYTGDLLFSYTIMSELLCYGGGNRQRALDRFCQNLRSEGRA